MLLRLLVIVGTLLIGLLTGLFIGMRINHLKRRKLRRTYSTPEESSIQVPLASLKSGATHVSGSKHFVLSGQFLPVSYN